MNETFLNKCHSSLIILNSTVTRKGIGEEIFIFRSEVTIISNIFEAFKNVKCITPFLQFCTWFLISFDNFYVSEEDLEYYFVMYYVLTKFIKMRK